MADRFTDLRDLLQATHSALTIQAAGERERLLVEKSMSVRDLRQECVAKFVHEAGNKGDYRLTLNGAALPLTGTVGQLPIGVVLTLERVQRQQTVTDVEIALEADGQRFVFQQLPAVLGRAKDIHPALAEWLNAQPDGISVSRRHAELLRQGAGYALRNITDRPAEKPIYINEGTDSERVVNADLPKPVTDGDTVRLGKISFILSIQAKES